MQLLTTFIISNLLIVTPLFNWITRPFDISTQHQICLYNIDTHSSA